MKHDNSVSQKTFRRDVLRRLVEAGKVEVVGSRHFDEMSGEQQATTTRRCAMAPNTWLARTSEVFYLHPTDFTSSSGSCWKNPDGTITLYVHSNSSYDFRRIA